MKALFQQPFLQQIAWKKHSLSLSMLALAFGFFLFSFYVHLEKERALDVARVDFQQQRNINQDASQSREIVDANIETYQALRTAGVVGDTQRLQWIELTQELSKHLGIPLIDFTLDSTEAMDGVNSVYWNSELSMQLTPMTLEINLRHEGEFFEFMEGLRLNAKGIFSIDSCDLRRNPTMTGVNPEYAGFQSKCKLIWYSIVDVTRDWELAKQ